MDEHGNVNANIVQARHFQLVAAENNVRAQLGTERDGQVSLEFYQEDGQTPRLSVGINSYGTAALDLRDNTGGARARVSVDPSGTPTTFNIRDEVNRIRAQVLLQDDGAVGVVLANPVGERRAFIGVLPDDLALFGLYDSDGNPADGMANR